ncbi:MAG: MFS transporter [Anaerolineae bacterium]|nr:MFS transporter [Anaerolineae bacterium]
MRTHMPAVAGIVIAQIGIPLSLFVNAMSFVSVVIALLMIDPSKLYPAPPVTHGSVNKRLIEGLQYAWRTPQVFLILLVIAALGTFGYNFGIVLPLLANFVLHTDAEGFGALSSFLGLGSLIAGIAIAYMPGISIRRLLLGSAAFSSLLGAVALSQVFALSAVLLVVLGFAGIMFSTTSNSLLQLIVPDHLRGRVMSLNVLLFMGSTPIGGFLIGLLSDHQAYPSRSSYAPCCVWRGLPPP